MSRDEVSSSILLSRENVGCSPAVTMEIKISPGQEFCSIYMANLPEKVWNILLSESFRREYNLAFPSSNGGKEGYPYAVSMLVYPGDITALVSRIRGILNPEGY